MKLSKNRTAKKLDNLQWVEVEFFTLKEGDIFKLFDGDLPVTDYDGFTIFTATSDAYLNADGIWQIDIECE